MSRPSSRAASHGASRSRSSSRHSSYSGAGGHHVSSVIDPDDFCNAFWAEKGFDALLSKAKASARTLDELRAWFRERAAVEDEYAKKLGRLGKAPVMAGGYEVGGLKDALEVVRKSTAQSGHSHAELAGTIKTAMEVKLGDFINRREALRKNPQGNIERLYKKRAELSEASEKSRKKYEGDAIAVNGFTAQTHLVQGRDLDKVSSKLEKAQSSVVVNEKEYRMYVKAMKETTGEWNLQWKGFCDLMQDMEEDRIDFLRATFWDYANSVSTICVVDDEQCEKIRTSLERCETARDIKAFVRLAGTGGEMFDAPDYVNYARGEQTQPRPESSTAHFARSSTRSHRSIAPSTSQHDLTEAIRSEPPAEPEPEPAPFPQTPPTVYQTKVNTKRGGSVADLVAANSMKPGSSQTLASPTAAPPRRAASPGEAMLKAVSSKPAVPPSVAAGAYVPPQYVPPAARATSPNPQTAPSAHPPLSPATTGRMNRYSGLPSASLASPGADLQRSQSRGSSAGGSATGPWLDRQPSRRQSAYAPPSPSKENVLPPPPPAEPCSISPAPLQPPSVPAQDGSVDPLVAALERLRSTPSMGSIRSPVVKSRSGAQWQADDRASTSGSGAAKRNTLDVQSMSIGGEVPRTGTPLDDRRSSQMAPPSAQQEPRAASPAPARPVSQAGARNSSLAAAVNAEPARGSSPGPQRPFSMAAQSPQPGQPFRQSTASRPQSYAQPSMSSSASWQQQRAPSPAPPTVASPPTESTEGDLLRSQSRGASRGARLGQMIGGQRTSISGAPPPRQPSPAPPQQVPGPHQPYASQYAPQRQGSVPPPATQYQQPPAQQQAMYQSQSVQQLHQPGPPPQQQPAYGYPQQAYTPQSPYAQTPQQPYMTPSQSFQQQQPSYYQQAPPQPQQTPAPQRPPPQQQQPPAAYQQSPHVPNGYSSTGYGQPNGMINGNHPSRTPSTYSSASVGQGYYQQAPAQQQPPPQQQQPPPAPGQQPNGQRPPATGSYTERGQPILFYVRALYDYAATQPDEFSFQAGDVIAITQTNPDGWWQGELLDELRRGVEGTTCPSNFLVLLD